MHESLEDSFSHVLEGHGGNNLKGVAISQLEELRETFKLKRMSELHTRVMMWS